MCQYYLQTIIFKYIKSVCCINKPQSISQGSDFYGKSTPSQYVLLQIVEPSLRNFYQQVHQVLVGSYQYQINEKSYSFTSEVCLLSCCLMNISFMVLVFSLYNLKCFRRDSSNTIFLLIYTIYIYKRHYCFV